MLLANAGIFIKVGEKRILIDALHNKGNNAFSSVSENVLEKVMNGEGDFAGIDIALFTHSHLDHYDGDLVSEFHKKQPGAKIFSTRLPSDVNGTLLTKERHYFDANGVKIYCTKATHDGPQYADYPNYSFTIEAEGKTLFSLGDCGFFEDEIKRAVGASDIDVAFLNFPYLCLKNGRAIVNNIIKPKKVIFDHIPFEKDDRFNYYKSSKDCFERYKNLIPPSAILNTELQKEYF